MSKAIIVFEDPISTQRCKEIETIMNQDTSDRKSAMDFCKKFLEIPDEELQNYLNQDGYLDYDDDAKHLFQDDENTFRINGYKCKRNPANCGCYTVYYNPGVKTIFHPNCIRVHCMILKDMYKKQKLDFETRFQWNQFKDKKMLFGKYKGKTFSELFRKHYCYLLSLTDKGLFGPIKQFVDLIKTNRFRDIL